MSTTPAHQAVSFTLLRHGQSTWNKASRIQGSSDFSELTDKGRKQARRAAEHIVSLGWSNEIDAVWSSPLTRARQTADIVLPSLERLERQDRCYTLLDALREIDLYSFQGLEKNAVPDEFRDAYAAWKANPAEFEIDGHQPVVELWDRAADAWRDLRSQPMESAESIGAMRPTSTLIVAHNATNQALLCTAMGLPPSMFRKVLQSNAAVSRLTFHQDDRIEDDDVAVDIKCINLAPDSIVDACKKQTEGELTVVSCGELQLGTSARETAFGGRATIVEADAATCETIVKERLRVTRPNVRFASDEGGLTVFCDDCLIGFNAK